MTTARGVVTGSCERMGCSAMRQNDITGAPIRSEPKLGNAWASWPSRNAATDSNSAAVTTPWPPRPCSRISNGGVVILAHRVRTSGRPGRDQAGQLDQPGGVAPLVVVPAEDLDQLTRGLGEQRVEDTGGRVADDVARDDRLGGVDQAAGEPAGRRGPLEGGVDLFGRDRLVEQEGEVDERTVDDGHAQRATVELAGDGRDDLGDGAGGAGRRRDDVDRGRTGAARILVRPVEE